MATIGVSLAQFGLKTLVTSLAGKAVEAQFGSLRLDIQNLLDAQTESFKRLDSRIVSAIKQNALEEQYTQFESWAELLKERLEKAEKGNKQPLLDLYKDFDNSTNGTNTRLLRVNNLLKGTNPYSDHGLIRLYLDKLYSKLSDENNWDYTISSYVDDAKKYLDYHIKMQGVAFSFQILAADDAGSRDTYLKNMLKRVQEQVQLALDSFPPLIKTLKYNVMETPMNTVHWFRFHQFNRPDYVLSYKKAGFWGGKEVALRNDAPGPSNEWRFNHALDTGGNVKLQCRGGAQWIQQKWSGGGGSLTGGIGGYGGGGGATGTWVTQMSGEGEAVSMKVIPLMDDINGNPNPAGKIGTDAVFKLKCEAGKLDGGFESAVFGRVWAIRDYQIWQDPQTFPAVDL